MSEIDEEEGEFAVRELVLSVFEGEGGVCHGGEVAMRETPEEGGGFCHERETPEEGGGLCHEREDLAMSERIQRRGGERSWTEKEEDFAMSERLQRRVGGLCHERENPEEGRRTFAIERIQRSVGGLHVRVDRQEGGGI